MTRDEPPAPSRRRRRRLLIGAGVALALIAGPVTYAAVRMDALINDYKEQLLPTLAAALGRPVTLGRISTTVLSGFGARLQAAALSGDPKSAAERDPLVTVREVRVGVAALPAILSAGRSLEVREVLVDGLDLRIVRYPDGTLNLDRLAAELAKGKKPEEDAPLDPAVRAYVEGLRIDAIRLRDARFRFVDLERGGATVEISHVDFTLEDFRPTAPFEATLTAAVLAAQPNLEIRTRFGRLPQTLDGPPALLGVKVKMDRTELAPLAPFLGRLVPGIERLAVGAELDADLGAASPGGAGPTSVVGAVRAFGVRFAGGGAPFDVEVAADLGADLPRGDVDLRRLHVGLGGMALDGKGKLHALTTAPRFEGFAIRSSGLSFDRLRALYPALDRAAGATLRGGFSVAAVASGGADAQAFDLSLDLTPASIVVPAALDKPAGTPLRLAVAGKARSTSVTIDRLALEIADWAVRGGGTVRNLAAPTFDLRLDAASPGLTGLLRLLPPVAAAVPPGAAIQGALTLHATLAGTPAALQASAELGLTGAKLEVDAARLVGAASVRVQATTRGEAVDAAVDVDLDRLEAVYADLIRKAAGTPLGMSLRVKRRADTLEPTFELRAAALRAQGSARVEGAVAPSFDATVTVAPFDVAGLTALLPSLATAGLPRVRVGAKVHARGKVDRPESMQVDLDGLELAAGRSDVAAKASVRNLLRPVIEATITSRHLDLDDLLPPAAAGAAPAAAAKEPAAPGTPAERGALAALTGHLTLDVREGKAAGIPYQGLRAALALEGGRARASTLEVGVMGGTFAASGTELDLVDPHGPFRVAGKIDRLDVAALLSRFCDSKRVLTGRLSGQLDVRGRGTTPAELQRSLEGALSGAVEEAAFLPANLSDLISRSLAAKLPFAKRATARLPSTALERLAGSVRFEAGSLSLHEPLQARTPLGPLTLTGRVLAAGTLDLDGKLELSPAAGSALVGNSVKLTEPVPLALHVGGPLLAPTVRPTALDAVAKVYLTAYAKGAAGKAVTQRAEQAADGLLKKAGVAGGLDAVPRSRAEAEAAARAQAEQVRRQAEAQAAARAAQLRAQGEAARKAAEARAKAEAERARQAAEQRAREEAKKKGKGMVRGLFGK